MVKSYMDDNSRDSKKNIYNLPCNILPMPYTDNVTKEEVRNIVNQRRRKLNKRQTRITHLAHIVVVRVEIDTQLRQQSRPPLQTTLEGDRCDEDADGSTDQGRWVANAVQTFCLDELCHVRRELFEVCPYVVLENKAAERPCWLICNNVNKT